MIEIENLNVKYGKKKIVEDVSFAVTPGEMTCLLGTNSSGKTSIMNAIMKLVPIESGQILLDKMPIKLDDLGRIAYVPDHPILLNRYLLSEMIHYMDVHYTHFNIEKAFHLVDFFNLRLTDRISLLSKGDQSKVNLLLGLAMDSDYLLMDEPFSGIDIFAREHIQSIFTTDIVENKGILFSTHEVYEIEHLVDKVIVLSDGKILKEFYPEMSRMVEHKSILDMYREVMSK